MKLGILGNGQLARMIALAGYPLNVHCVFLDPTSDGCASTLGESIVAPYDDPKGLSQLAQIADYITFEFENVPGQTLEYLSQQMPVHPPAKALLITQDRLGEKQMFNNKGIETAPFAQIDNLTDLQKAIDNIGMPGILKTRRLGYDGKGQAIIRQPSELKDAWQSIGAVPATYEGFVAYNREVSIIAVRAQNGEVRFYPLVENIHRNGILSVSTAQINDPAQQQAEEIAHKVLDSFSDYVGILVIEFFQVGDKLLVNEFAPRVHNSGHWTIEGAATSQFENHLRAVTGMPLGDTNAICPSAMINIIGKVPNTHEILKVPGAHLHLYDKEARAKRKIGHITVCANNAEALSTRIGRINSILH